MAKAGKRWQGAVLPGLILAMLAVGAVQGQPGSGSVSLDEYRKRLGEAAHLLATDGGLPAAQEILVRVEVVLPSGETVNTQPLLADVTDITIAQQRLTTVQRELRAAVYDNSTARLAVLARVQERLSLDRPTLWQRFRNWLADLLEPLFSNGSAGPIASGATTLLSTLLVWLIVGVGGVLLALLFSYWLQRLLGNFVAEAESRRRLEEDPEGLPLTAEAARQQAFARAHAGSYREAVRRLYLAALLHLDERGLVRYDRSLTNGEVLKQVPPATAMHQHLELVVGAFDRVWYGVQEPDHATFQSYQGQIDALMAIERDEDGRHP